ncbi:MAG: HypC/HybG/HupF family hydrogenase formation chaperone [archaeon GB-1867-097]|nr:HypC/HybG/HupF family hydrogenase formation chaperone [Candidatus Culexmicrobium thermophilum]MCS7384273.1 HypC/HybG/HupF family hydrogenase formation chaperone [Candidatus Culexmicrobium thermophilum]HDO20094.1 HypC/HybG/HupF family hydrogenase formation chaperone [Candidatus Bathyarchaeota archaeon]
MCLAVPAKIISVNGDLAKADFGGVRREIVVTLIEDEVKPGDYVLVHAGFAIQKIREEEALKILEAWREIFEEG